MMNEARIKSAVKSIEMPAEAKSRVVERCKAARKDARRNYVRTAVLAAVLIAFAGLSVLAAGSSGVFEDITNWQGAVVGGRYVQATGDAILQVKEVWAENGHSRLTLEIAFANPDERPFSSIEEIDLGEYSVFGADGELAAGENGPGKLNGGTATIEITLDGTEFAKGETYSLKVESFYGVSKADQPLKIEGEWLVEFAIG